MMVNLSIEEILTTGAVESSKLEYKEGWNATDIIRTITAFANDVDDNGGGYLIIGVKEEDGTPERPVKGLPKNRIDQYQKELLNLTNRIQPEYTVSCNVEKIDGNLILVVKCYKGDSGPYDCPISISERKSERASFIRKGSNTVKARSQADFNLLSELRNNLSFDERRCTKATIDDIEIDLLIDYLKTVKSPLLQDKSLLSSKYELLQALELTCHPKENKSIKNAAILLFSKKPNQFFPAAKVDLVIHALGGDKQFEEKTFEGPLFTIIENVLDFFNKVIKRTIVLKVDNQASTTQIDNYPYIAMRECIANAILHQGYDQNQHVEIQVFHERIEILSYPGALPPITNSQLLQERVTARNYRNRQIGIMLKEYGLTESRATGFPMIRRRLEKNGSPPPTFETDDEHRSYFKATLQIHQEFIVEDPAKIEVTETILDDLDQQILESCLDSPISLAQLKERFGDDDIADRVNRLISEEYLGTIDENYIQITPDGKNRLMSSF